MMFNQDYTNLKTLSDEILKKVEYFKYRKQEGYGCQNWFSMEISEQNE